MTTAAGGATVSGSTGGIIDTVGCTGLAPKRQAGSIDAVDGFSVCDQK